MLLFSWLLLWSCFETICIGRNIGGLAWLDESDTGGISAANSETLLDATFSQQFQEF